MLWSHHLPCPLPHHHLQIKYGEPIPDMVLPVYNNVLPISHKVDQHQQWRQLNLVFIINRLLIHSRPHLSYTKIRRIIIISNLLLLPIQRLLCPLTPLAATVVVHLTNNNIEIQLHHGDKRSIPQITTTILIPRSMITLPNKISILSPPRLLRPFRPVHIQHLKGLRLKYILDLFLVLVLVLTFILWLKLHLHLLKRPITVEDRIPLDLGNHTITRHLHRPHRHLPHYRFWIKI